MSVRIAGSAKCWLAGLLLGGLLGCGGASGQKTLYVVGTGTPQLAAFQVSSTGELTLPKLTSVGAAPAGLAIDPQKRFAYVLNSALGAPGGAISQFTLLAASGALAAQTESNTGATTTGPVPPVPTGATPVAIAVDARGQFVFVANQGDSTISAFSINRSTGALSQIGNPVPTAPASGPSALRINGNRLFVGNLAGGISVFTFDSKTGALTQLSGSPFAASTNFCAPALDTNGKFVPCSMALDPKGKSLYVPNKSANTVAVFNIDGSGNLSPATVPAVAAGTMPVAVNVAHSGKFLYVANWGTNDLSIFAIGAAGFTPVLGSPFPSGTNPSSMLNDNSGKLLFVTNAGSDDVSVFQINGNTGRLTPAAGSPFATVGSPVGMATIN